MKSLFPLDTFAGFGASYLHPFGYKPFFHQICGHKSAMLRAGVRSDAPRVPGVYGMLDHGGQLIRLLLNAERFED